MTKEKLDELLSEPSNAPEDLVFKVAIASYAAAFFSGRLDEFARALAAFNCEQLVFLSDKYQKQESVEFPDLIGDE